MGMFLHSTPQLLRFPLSIDHGSWLTQPFQTASSNSAHDSRIASTEETSLFPARSHARLLLIDARSWATVFAEQTRSPRTQTRLFADKRVPGYLSDNQLCIALSPKSIFSFISLFSS